MALQDNIILQKNDLLHQKRDISKMLLEITSKIDSLTKKNEWRVKQVMVSVAQNASKILQEAFKTTSRKLVELERQYHNLEQHTRRECLDFSGIPNSVAPKDLENLCYSFYSSYYTYVFCRKSILILKNCVLLLAIGWKRQIERFSTSWIERMLKMCIQIRNWKMLIFRVRIYISTDMVYLDLTTIQHQSLYKVAGSQAT